MALLRSRPLEPRRALARSQVVAAAVVFVAAAVSSSSPASAADVAERAANDPWTTTIPVTCTGADPSNPMDPTGWVSAIDVSVIQPGTVPFGGSIPVTVSASYVFDGPTSWTSLDSELVIGQLDRDGEGVGARLVGSGATDGVVTMAPSAPVTIEARGNVGGTMQLIVDQPLQITWHTSGRFISWTTVANCTPATPTVVGTVFIAPPTSGQPAGDDVTVRVTFANGTVAWWNGMLGTGDIDEVIDPDTGQLTSLAGAGTATTWDGTTFVVGVDAQAGPPIGGVPNLTKPTVGLVLLNPPSGQVVWVPATPANGIAMLTDGNGSRTTDVVAIARGLLLPSGEPVTVSIGIRDLLHR